MEKILIVEEDDQERKNIIKYIEMGNYRVFSACNGEDGMDLFMMERPAIVFTGLNMPEIDGLSLMKAVKDIDEDVEVIVVSGYGSFNEAVEFLRLGASDFLQKPVKLAHVDVILKRALLKYRMKNRVKKAYKFTNAIIDAATGFYISTCDVNGNIVTWNKGAELIMGYLEDEVVEKMHFSKMLSDEAVNAGLMDEIVDRLIEGKRFEKEINFEKKDGIIFPGFFCAAHLNDDNGNLIGMLAIVRDITEAKLAGQKLILARQEAEAANKAKSEFLANMSHEIRTPMNGIIGMTDLLLDTELNEQQRDFAETVSDASDALLVLINDILDFSKIEAGKLDLEYIDFDLAVMLDQTAGSLAFKAKEKGIELGVFLQPEIINRHVKGDPVRIGQVILNLAGNAVKFTQKGEVVITGELERENEKEICVKFSVKDTGIGIPKNALTKLFQTFSQVDSSTTRKYGGTGLGLAISKQLVEMMGGEIGVESEDGKGTTFWFTLTLKKQVDDNTDFQPNLQIGEKELNKRHSITENFKKNIRILIVEDNVVNQKVFVKIFKKFGYSAQCAVNGKEAVECLRTYNYDAVFMDCQMPVMGGLEATALIRKEEEMKKNSGKGHGRTPIIALTANAMKGDREKCIAAGMDDYISKPVKPDTLREVLEHWIMVFRDDMTG